MRLRTILGALLLLQAVLISCEKEDSSHGSMTVHVDEVAATSVTVSFTAETPTNVSGYYVGICVSEKDPIGTNVGLGGIFSDEDDNEVYVEADAAKMGRATYTLTVNRLKPEKKYNVRAFILAGIGGLATWGDMNSFTTQSPSKPKLLSSDVTEVNTTSVTMVVNWSDNASKITEMGVIVAKSESELSASSAIKVTGWYEFTVSGLEHSTKYYAKAYATNAKGTAYSEVFSFTTLDQTEEINKLQGEWSFGLTDDYGGITDVRIHLSLKEDYSYILTMPAWNEQRVGTYEVADFDETLTLICTKLQWVINNNNGYNNIYEQYCRSWSGSVPTFEDWAREYPDEVVTRLQYIVNDQELHLDGLFGLPLYETFYRDDNFDAVAECRKHI